MQHKRPCKYCAGQFQPVRQSHLYCSETCRKLAFKAKNRGKTQAKRNRKLSEKLKKLSNSAFGLYLVKEIRRAGTVEILQKHNPQSLTELVSLRRRCTAVGGYEKGKPQAYYELSHIYPVSGKDRLGLLNISNLVITPKRFNRKHGKKVPIKGYLGSSTPRNKLLKQWKVPATLESLEVLKIARRYIGEEFDIWLKKHLISQTQKQTILKKFKETGFDYDILKTMSLKELKLMADEEEIPYFSINNDPMSEVDVAEKEMRRLNIDPKLTQILSQFWELNDVFGDPELLFKGNDKELASFKEFVSQQANLCMHGQLYEMSWNGIAFEDYFEPFVRH